MLSILRESGLLNMAFVSMVCCHLHNYKNPKMTYWSEDDTFLSGFLHKS